MGKKSKSKDKARKRERKKSLRPAEMPATTDAAGPAPEADITREAERQRVGATELAARLASLSTVLQRHLSRADAGDGLTRARLSALALLVFGGPRTLGDLAGAEHVRPPTMTRLVHAMEADGLVVRKRNPDDGRSVVIHATARGVEQLASGRTRQIAPLAATISGLDQSDRLRLEDAADLLGGVLRATAWEHPADKE